MRLTAERIGQEAGMCRMGLFCWRTGGNDARVSIIPVSREGALPLPTRQRDAAGLAQHSELARADEGPLYPGAFVFV